jgi:hypothetical protein
MLKSKKPEQTILEEAMSLVGGERQDDYGDFKDMFVRWREACHACGRPGLANVTGEDLATAMILLKVIRDATRPKRDNPVDIAGWAHGLDIVRGE